MRAGVAFLSKLLDQIEFALAQDPEGVTCARFAEYLAAACPQWYIPLYRGRRPLRRPIPTTVPPGPGKVAVLALRYQRGEELWCPGLDCDLDQLERGSREEDLEFEAEKLLNGSVVRKGRTRVEVMGMTRNCVAAADVPSRD